MSFGTYFFANQAYPAQEADSGDLEEMELLLWTPEDVEQAMAEGKVHSLDVLSILLLGLRCLK